MARRLFTEQELRATYAARRNASWPASFEEAMNDPVFRSLLCCAARGRKAPKAPQPRQLMPTPHTPAQLDFKRRAAGERDEE